MKYEPKTAERIPDEMEEYEAKARGITIEEYREWAEKCAEENDKIFANRDPDLDSNSEMNKRSPPRRAPSRSTDCTEQRQASATSQHELAASPYLAHFKLMAQYNAWAYKRVFDAARKLSDDQYRADYGLPFLSVHGTLCHLLLGDILWYMRMTGISTVNRFEYTAISSYWSGSSEAWENAVPSLNELEALVLEQCGRVSELIDGLDDAKLATKFNYKNTRGDALQQTYGPLLDHVFNHGTHHRGQVSAAISRAGQPYPEMDLLYFINSDA